MWICKKCNEENEENFDTCYKCLTLKGETPSKSEECQQGLEVGSNGDNYYTPKEILFQDNKFLNVLAGVVGFLVFVFSYGSSFNFNQKNDATVTFFAVFSNTVKSWAPNFLDEGEKYMEDLSSHYFIETRTDKFEYYLMFFASILPYIMIVSLVFFWMRSSFRNK